MWPQKNKKNYYRDNLFLGFRLIPDTFMFFTYIAKRKYCKIRLSFSNPMSLPAQNYPDDSGLHILLFLNEIFR